MSLTLSRQFFEHTDFSGAINFFVLDYPETKQEFAIKVFLQEMVFANFIR